MALASYPDDEGNGFGFGGGEEGSVIGGIEFEEDGFHGELRYILCMEHGQSIYRRARRSKAQLDDRPAGVILPWRRRSFFLSLFDPGLELGMFAAPVVLRCRDVERVELCNHDAEAIGRDPASIFDVVLSKVGLRRKSVAESAGIVDVLVSGFPERARFTGGAVHCWPRDRMSRAMR